MYCVNVQHRIDPKQYLTQGAEVKRCSVQSESGHFVTICSTNVYTILHQTHNSSVE
jgi:hypothetical protein